MQLPKLDEEKCCIESSCGLNYLEQSSLRTETLSFGRMASLPTSDSTASFWHSEPSEFLLGHRTTPVLPTEADIVIVGSGITGTSAARFLAEDARARELNVVMLDAREACWCATGRVC